MKIFVTEIQEYQDGTTSTPSFAYENRNEAEAKYHAILSAAAVSSVPIHSAMMFQSDGSPVKHESFTH